MMRLSILALATILLPSVAQAQEGKCQRDLSFAAGAYRECMEKTMGLLYGGAGFPSPVAAAFGKCVDKYSATWPKLVSKHAGKGTSCSGARYVDNGDGTFDDRLTRLTWEAKSDDGSIHDWDDAYSRSAGPPWKETGTAFTTFLAGLNASGFGGSNGWRLPSVHELYTLVAPGYPNCKSPPCTTAPGLTQSGTYGVQSTGYGLDISTVWRVDFGNGVADLHLGGTEGTNSFMRAVRSGS
ncbi:MAG: DUF1566 domain-containing protein [Alphaproteobacteria bacterium]